ncbi:hypothetical protein ACHAXM_000717, partial [Skeletonema potamos]
MVQLPSGNQEALTPPTILQHTLYANKRHHQRKRTNHIVGIFYQIFPPSHSVVYSMVTHQIFPRDNQHRLDVCGCIASADEELACHFVGRYPQ